MKAKTISAALVAAAALVCAASAQAQETPKRGGTLTFAVEGEPNTYDCHAGNSFAVLHFVAPHYSTLLRYNTAKYPTIEGDAAESWTVSPDGLTYTFKLRPNIRFHDGSAFTAADVKATYERLRTPPQGVVSVRRAEFSDVQSIEATDPQTAVFKLSKPNSAMLATFANPWNCLYSAAKLAQDPNFPATNIFGTGPFAFVEYQRGAQWTGKRFDGYFRTPEPYLDGFRAIQMTSPSTINALAGGQVDATFRVLTNQERDRIASSRGDKMTFPQNELIIFVTVSFNAKKAPFDDVRVRKALSLAIDRWGGVENLSKISNMKWVGGLLRPTYELATPKEDLMKLPGFATDMSAQRAEARKLLAEAGVPNLRFKLLNRTVQIPYGPLGVFLIDQWRQIGVSVEQTTAETGPYLAGLTSGEYEVAIDFNNPPVDEPTLALTKFLPGAGNNYAHNTDPLLVDLFERQKRTLDVAERKRLLAEFEQRVIGQAYVAPLFWADQQIALASDVRGYYLTPSFFVGHDLGSVWLNR
jgi:peptide/nickel transport system substrate-binding protein